MKITDKSLLNIQNMSGRGFVSGDGQELKIKSGNSIVAWIKSKASKAHGDRNAQARSNFVDKLAKDLNLSKGLKNRLAREINVTKRTPFNISTASAKIGEFIKLAELADKMENNKLSDKDAFKSFFAKHNEAKSEVPHQNGEETVKKKRPVISEQLAEKIRNRPNASDQRILEKTGLRQAPVMQPINMQAFEHQDTHFFEDEPESKTTENSPSQSMPTIETISPPREELELKIEERSEEKPTVLSTEPKVETSPENVPSSERKKLPNSHFMRIAGLIKDAPTTPTTTPPGVEPKN